MPSDLAPVMITVAPNGSRIRSTDHPKVPVSPQAIAATIEACVLAGASIAHIHARAADESPTHEVSVFREIVDETRRRCDAVLQLSLGTRGFTPEQAVAPLALFPEMVSLPLRLNGPDPGEAKRMVHAMAAKVHASAAIPEMSIYDEAMLDTALELIEAGLVRPPYCFGLVLARRIPSNKAPANSWTWRQPCPRERSGGAPKAAGISWSCAHWPSPWGDMCEWGSKTPFSPSMGMDWR